MSAFAQDVQQIESKRNFNFAEGLAAVAKATGRNPISIALDFNRVRKMRGKLWFYEYIQYGLYDRDAWSDDDRARFISAHVHWPVVSQCNNEQWWAVTEDKWLSSVILEHNDIPVPTSLAVFDPGNRSYPNLERLKTAADFENYFKSGHDYPIFAKCMDGMWSAGAFRIDDATTEHLEIAGHGPVRYEDMPATFLGDKPYIFQKCLKPHAFFDGLTDAIATVRCLNLIDDTGLRVPHAVLKLPTAGNVADNFWRSGNLLCALDTKTGEITGIVDRENGALVRLDALPNSDRKLVGETLPDWQALRDVNARVALMHSENRFGSTDMALTTDGPVVVEVNNGCAFELFQIATGNGFLTDDMLAFFNAQNVKL